jgi:hypothetical protein
MLFKVCLNSVPVHSNGGHAYVSCKLHLVVSGMHLSGVLVQSSALGTPEMRIQCLSSHCHMCPPCVKVQSDSRGGSMLRRQLCVQAADAVW